jgi:deazaflavin-dependent oxidoreductase (nitroreductase family)
MTTFKHKMQRLGNQIGVWMYRASDGRLASHSKNIKVLMITTPGRRTGVLHSTCVRYLETTDGLLVWGTASGARHDPDWFRNLRKAKTADVQIGAKTLQVRPRELLGAERDAAWNGVVLPQAPEVEKYAQRAGRTIPVALLRRMSGS